MAWFTFSTLLYVFLLLLCYPLYTFLNYSLIQPYRRCRILRSQHIRGPSFVPFLGQIPLLNDFVNRDAILEFGPHMVQRYGHVCQYFLGPWIVLQLSDVDYVLAAWKTQHSHYHKGLFTKTMMAPLLGMESLVLVDEPTHGRNRRMIAPAFHFTHLQQMTSIMQQETLTAIEQLLPTTPSSPTSPMVEVELHKWFIDLALSIILASSFGSSLALHPEARDVIYNALTVVLRLMQTRSLMLVSHFPIIRDLPILGKTETDRGKAEMERVVMQMVKDRREGRSHSQCQGQDLLDILLSARDEKGEGFTDEQIRADAMTFVLAGHETTSSLMVWTMRDLMLRPALYAKCRAEVDRVVGDGPILSHHIADLPLIDACIHETFRLRPPVPVISIQASVDHTLTPENGKPPLFIPAETNVWADCYVMQRSTELWGPTAGQWDGQRWIKGSDSYFKPKHPVAFNGFSVGSRSCIGSQFALLEARLMTALIVRELDLEMVEGQEDVVEQKLTITPKHGLKARVKRRERTAGAA